MEYGNQEVAPYWSDQPIQTIDEFGQPATISGPNVAPSAPTPRVFKPWDFSTAIAGWNYDLGGYGQPLAQIQPYAGDLNARWGEKLNQTMRDMGLEGGYEDLAPMNPHPADQARMNQLFTQSGFSSDPMYPQWKNWWDTGIAEGRASDAREEAALKAQSRKNVMLGLSIVGSVMGAGALGALGAGGAGAAGGLGAEAGLGGLAGGAGEAGWGVMQGLSPAAAEAISPTIIHGGLSSAAGGSGLGTAFGLESGLITPAAAAAGAGAGAGAGGGGGGGGGLNLGSYGPAFDSSVVGSAVSPEAMASLGAYPMSGTAGAFTSLPTFSTGGANVGFSGASGGSGGMPSGGGAPSAPGGGGLSPGAAQAVNAPPGAATPGGAVGSNVGGGSGGGDFVSGILEQFKKNALSIGLMGLSMLGAGSQQGKEPESIKQLGQNASTASGLANQYLAAAQAGQLTGPQQASLDKYKQDAKNQVRQYFASIGQFDSTSRIQAEAQIDQAAVAMQQQLIQETLQNGLSLMNASNTPLTTVAQYQAGQDQALVNAMGNFAQGIGSLFGQKAGQGQINQPQQPQQNPPFPPNTGPQQQPLTQNQPIIQQEPFVDQTAP